MKSPIVSLLYARDDLNWAQYHDCIISLTPAGAAHARKIAPKAKVAALGWGVDLSFFPRRSYELREFFLIFLYFIWVISEHSQWPRGFTLFPCRNLSRVCFRAWNGLITLTADRWRLPDGSPIRPRR